MVSHTNGNDNLISCAYLGMGTYDPHMKIIWLQVHTDLDLLYGTMVSWPCVVGINKHLYVEEASKTNTSRLYCNTCEC